MTRSVVGETTIHDPAVETCVGLLPCSWRFAQQPDRSPCTADLPFAFSATTVSVVDAPM